MSDVPPPSDPGTPPPPPPGDVTPVVPDPADVEKNKTMAVLGYILFFIPLLAAKDSPFAKYHANQGLNVFLLWLADAILFGCGGFLVTFITFGYGGCICFPLLGLVSVAILVFAVIGIINALNGQMKPLPLIGGIKLLK